MASHTPILRHWRRVGTRRGRRRAPHAAVEALAQRVAAQCARHWPICGARVSPRRHGAERKRPHERHVEARRRGAKVKIDAKRLNVMHHLPKFFKSKKTKTKMLSESPPSTSN